MKEIETLTLLSGAPLIGPARVRQLLNYFGSANEALEAGSANWSVLPGFSKKIIDSWTRWYESAAWEQNLDLVERYGVKLVSFMDSDYPKRLLELPDYPIILYVKGELLPQDEKSIAVIGTRNATIYGLETAEKISEELVSLGFTVVSGLARGIDTAAHYGALKQGRTLAVIGSGLANIYPRENESLGRKISENGALISEFPMATPPDRQNFPQRNRIVSGMTLGSLLIEAPSKSGAMLTMGRALAQGRKLFVIPGRVDNENFKGNLSLLKEGKAHLVDCGEDLLRHFSGKDDLSQRVEISQKKRVIPLDEDEKKFLDLLPNEEIPIDKISELSKLSVGKVHVLLMGLLLKCAVREYPGKIYKKLI